MTFTQVVLDVFISAFIGLGNYLPQFFGGLLILIVGLITAAVLRHAVEAVFKIARLDKLAEDAKIAKAKTVQVWSEFFAELVRWSTVIVFLIPTVEAWGITRITSILNQLLFYLPNVFVAVVVGFVGFVIANLISDGVSHSLKGLGAKSTGLLSTIARYAVLFFTTLIVLHQLGVAADLIRILFTGIVAMLALAGGLAFGLGGQDAARGFLADLDKKLKK